MPVCTNRENSAARRDRVAVPDPPRRSVHVARISMSRRWKGRQFRNENGHPGNRVAV
jgi:hypothetical protein